MQAEGSLDGNTHHCYLGSLVQTKTKKQLGERHTLKTWSPKDESFSIVNPWLLSFFVVIMRLMLVILNNV